MELTDTKYKQTEVGLIPKDWEVNKLGELTLSIESGNSITRNENGNFDLYGSTGIIGTKSYYDYSGDRLLVARVGANAGNLYKVGGYYCVSDNTLMLKCTSKLNINYCFYWLTNFNLNKLVFGSGQPLITGGQLKSLDISIPTLTEQKTIAQVLSDTDALIQALEKKIAKKKLIKKGVMQKLLTPKKDWEVKTLGEVGEGIIGLTYSPNDVRKNGTLVLRSSNVQKGQLAFADNVFVEMDLPGRVIVKENDILICVRNGSKRLIGKCALIDKKTAGSAFGAFMTVYRSQYSKYIFYVFQSHYIQRQIDEVMGATINQITNKDLNSFVIPFPSVEEQNRIAQILSDLDVEIQHLIQKSAKYKLAKQGMMQQLLTGKIRLV